ncbi:hypothetical protein, partial [Dermacoccus nishinomiyaensis]|uniref:hypothetical protein n=1 Tax=Dermacoccus nishinomiyaensis TaxID=1274 RepID=UPI001C92F20F
VMDARGVGMGGCWAREGGSGGIVVDGEEEKWIGDGGEGDWIGERDGVGEEEWDEWEENGGGEEGETDRRGE